MFPCRFSISFVEQAICSPKYILGSLSKAKGYMDFYLGLLFYPIGLHICFLPVPCFYYYVCSISLKSGVINVFTKLSYSELSCTYMSHVILVVSQHFSTVFVKNVPAS